LNRLWFNFGQAKFGWSGSMLEPIYTTAPAASKNDTRLKGGQNLRKDNHLTSLI